ncbi:Ig-like domain-containing protein, partial [Rhizobacter sp. SG703]|uniref:Ig-like domain-containing protein n=1 Tax=Rhizobacter sp. SG703 TaxID=2587140 RepID=UPI0014464753
YGVQARDAAGNWSNAVNVTLNVTDVDDTAPVVAASQSFSYAENQTAGATLGIVSASDAVGVTGYRFGSTGTSTSADGFYSIDASGQVSLTSSGAAAAANDYETLPNSFTYGVQARDAAGNWSNAVNITLNVTDVNEALGDSTPPVVAANQSFTYAENRSAGTVLGTVSATDAMGITGYRFGSTGSSTSADGFYSIDANGQVSLTSAGAAAAANDYETQPNSFTYGVQAGDAAGNWSGAVNVTLNVTDVDDTAPVLAANQSFSYAENQPAGTVLATVSANDAVGVTGFRFSDTGTGISADGHYRIDSTGRISLTTAGTAAAANDFETLPDSFTEGVQARDAAGNWSSAVSITLALTDVNENTVAPDRLQVAEDTPAQGNVLGNDTGGPSSVVSFGAGSSTIAAGGTLELAGVGSVTIAANGDFVFVPRPDWHGKVPTITYTTDHGQASVLELVVSPVNDAPALNPDALTTFEGVPWEGRLPAGTDADGDTLAYALVQGPQHGTVTLAGDGHYRYTPDAGYAGTDRFRVEVGDGQGGSARAWVDVTVEPSPTLRLPAPSDLGVSSTDRTTSADAITLSGSGTPGQALQLYDPAGRLIASTAVDANGEWHVEGIDMRSTRGDTAAAAAGAPGAYTFTLRAALPGGTLSAPVQLTVQRELAVVAAPAEPVPAPASEPAARAPVAAPETAPPPQLPRATFDSALPPESRPDGQLVAARVQDTAAQSAFSLPVRDANVADIYTRPSGFQIMVNPSPEPSLKLFRGLDDQVAKLGGTVRLQVPADTFIHTNIHETVVLQATLADGRPLPRWLQFDGRTGTLNGEVPAEWRDDVVIRVMARDSQGREATTMMRLKVSAGQASGAGLSRQLMQGRGTPLGAAGRATVRA